ncbi:MAG: response regulator [Planctomycetota bacterium]|nr:MAG: response regulator [Planctomycetota bacterium]
MASEVILLEPDPEARLMVRSLLERDGNTVIEANDPRHAADVLRASNATAILVSPSLSAQYPTLAEDLSALQANIDVLVPTTYADALMDGAAEGGGLAEFARDALLLLSILAEEGAGGAPSAEKLGRMTELTALRMGLSRYQVDACASAAALVALGPSLVKFRFGVDPTQGASGGLSHDLQASLAALAALRCPYDLRRIIEAVDEMFDGRGRPRGLAGEQIPVGARIIAVTRDYCRMVAEGTDPMAATELIRTKQGQAYDPQVIQAFFGALRDETYVDRMESGTTGAKVLVIDGEASSLSVMEMRLQSAGFQVLTANNGAKGFEMIGSERPDVVIADTVLPKLDGISLLLKMRRTPELKGIPLVFTSARTDPGLLNKALKLGAKDVLAKPVNYDVLFAKLRALSAAKQGQAQAQGQGAQGNLADMPLVDFFRVLSLGRKTCKVSVQGPQGQAEVFFEQGSPVAAYTATERGREAFATVVTWTQGVFTMIVGETPPEHNLDRGLEALLK